MENHKNILQEDLPFVCQEYFQCKPDTLAHHPKAQEHNKHSTESVHQGPDNHRLHRVSAHEQFSSDGLLF
jgi:hypothetical protein